MAVHARRRGSRRDAGGPVDAADEVREGCLRSQLAASATTSAATTVRATTIPTARQVDRTRTLVDAALGAPALTAVAP